VKKIAQNVTHSIFSQNEYITYTVGKSSPRICVNAVIFTTLPKENNRPLGGSKIERMDIFYCKTLQNWNFWI
jgi:hypothetical protein